METKPAARARSALSVGAEDGSSVGALPNLIVIGAQKCGTSVLHYYLGLHPEISMSQTKELNYFIQERNWPQGVDWYRAHFDPEATVRGEASPNYSADPVFAGVPKRMHSVVPEARLIYLVRDPLERIAAHWVHNVAKGRVKGDLRETLLNPKTSYIARSRYHMQLQRFLRFYPLERLLVLEQNDLRDRRAETLRSVFEFAGVDAEFSHARFRHERHKTGRKTQPTRLGTRLEERRARAQRHMVPPEAWALAREYWPLGRRIGRPDVRGALPNDVIATLREDAMELRRLTDRGFEHWSIWSA
jgi:hypothetical protein